MRILIDTNIFIELEGQSVIRDSCLSLLKSLEDSEHKVLVHPASVDDLQRDSDHTRQQSNLSKVRKYSLLERPPDCLDEFTNQFGLVARNDNDRVDHDLLCAVYRNSVHILISEDQALHRKAKLLGISNRVFYAEQAANSLKIASGKVPIALPNIEQVLVHEIQHLLSSTFFDSLRLSYDAFDEWFINKCSREGREAWVFWKARNEIGALCIFKNCKDEIITDDNRSLPGESLKLCTFKVDPSVQGRKIGELFLKAAFRYATQNSLLNIFIEMRPEQAHLAAMCDDFGFEKIGTKGSDDVYVKRHPIIPPKCETDSLTYHQKFAPHFSGMAEVRKYIVPIRPEYHRLLFPDWEVSPDQLKLPLGNRTLPGDALKLAYLCRSNIKSIQPGDVLLFYRSTDVKELTTIGIVESAEHLNDLDKILERVLKRTVYGVNELETMAISGCLVILFRLANHLKNEISSDMLVKLGVEGSIQSVRQINDDIFTKVVEKGSIENCFLAD